jgi:hypothetical protein
MLEAAGVTDKIVPMSGINTPGDRAHQDVRAASGVFWFMTPRNVKLSET